MTENLNLTYLKVVKRKSSPSPKSKVQDWTGDDTIIEGTTTSAGGLNQHIQPIPDLRTSSRTT